MNQFGIRNSHKDDALPISNPQDSTIEISSDDCRVVKDRRLTERERLLKAMFSDTVSSSVKRSAEEMEKEDSEHSVKRSRKEQEEEQSNTEHDSDGGSDIGTFKNSDRIVVMEKTEEEEEEEEKDEQPLVIDQRTGHLPVDDDVSFKSRQDEVVLRCIIWNGKRSMYHCRKCQLCDQFVPVYFWIKHIKLEKHVKKVKSFSYIVPPLHNSRTYLKEMKLYDNLLLFENEERTPDPIHLSSADENDSAKSALTAASVTGSVISKDDRNKNCYCSYCDKGPMTYFEKCMHEENWHESEIKREVEKSLQEIEEKRRKCDPLYCEICNVKVFTEEYMVKHKAGKKHKFNLDKHGKGETGQSITSDKCVEVVAEKGFKYCQQCQKKLSVTNWSHHVKTRKHRNNVLKTNNKKVEEEKEKDIEKQKERGTDAEYECRACERFFKDKSVWLKHLSSKKHIQIVANAVCEGKSDKKAVGSLFLCTFTKPVKYKLMCRITNCSDHKLYCKVCKTYLPSETSLTEHKGSSIHVANRLGILGYSRYRKGIMKSNEKKRKFIDAIACGNEFGLNERNGHCHAVIRTLKSFFCSIPKE